MSMETKKIMIIISVILVLSVLLVLLYPLRHGKEIEKNLEKTSFCGDTICDENENFYDCCEDCGCPSGEYCDERTKKCEILSVELSENEINSLVRGYLKDKIIHKIQPVGVTVFNNEPVKIVTVNISSEKGTVTVVLGITQEKIVYTISPLG